MSPGPQQSRPSEVRIHIDQQPYHSPNPTTGAALYTLGQVREGYELFKEVEGNREDKPVPSAGETVHLKEDEHFHSAEVREKTFDITVNGTQETWHRRKITYQEVVTLAFPGGPSGADIRYSVSWTKPDGQEGSLRPGHSISVVERMMFDVRNTDKS
jgi:hypothetical protein